MSTNSRIVRFLLTGDARSAIHAQEEAAKGFEKTGRAADKGSKHVGALSKAFDGMKNVIGFGAGALGLGAVAFGIKDAVQGAKAWQEQQAQLQNALKVTGNLNKQQEKQAESAARSSSVHGGFAPTQELAGITQLIRLTGSTTQAIKLNRTAVNLARGAHIEYSQALKLVARAQSGTAGKAQQYLGIIQPVKTYVNQLTSAQKTQNPLLLRHAELLDKQATAMEINQVVMKKYAGAASAYSHTASGAMSNFQHVLDIVLERVGHAFLPIITKAANAGAKAAQWIIAHWSRISGVFKTVFAVIGTVVKGGISVISAIVKWTIKYHQIVLALAIGIGAVVIPIGAYVAAMAIASAATTAWGATMAFAASALYVLTSPVTLIILAVAAIAAGIAYAYMHFKTFRDVVQAVFGVVKSIILGAVNFIGEHWKLLLAIFAAPILPIVLIVKNFGAIKSTVESVFSGIGSFVTTVFDGIVNGVIKGVNLIIKAINFIISGYNAIPSFFRPTGTIKTIGEISEVGKKTPAHGTPSASGAGHDRARHEGRPAHIHLHLGEGAGKEIASVLIKDAWASRALAESSTHYTLKRAARA